MSIIKRNEVIAELTRHEITKGRKTDGENKVYYAPHIATLEDKIKFLGSDLVERYLDKGLREMGQTISEGKDFNDPSFPAIYQSEVESYSTGGGMSIAEIDEEIKRLNGVMTEKRKLVEAAKTNDPANAGAILMAFAEECGEIIGKITNLNLKRDARKREPKSGGNE